MAVHRVLGKKRGLWEGTTTKKKFKKTRKKRPVIEQLGSAQEKATRALRYGRGLVHCSLSLLTSPSFPFHTICF